MRNGEEKGKRTQNVLNRNLRFWGRSTLESVGITLAVSAMLFVIYGMGNGDFFHLSKLREHLAVMPYYLYMAGAFTVLMLAIGYFQTYFQLLVSMNNTRKTVAAGILISVAVLILFVNGAAWATWKAVGGEASAEALSILPVLLGGCFISAAFSVLLGVVMTRWGKIGTIILTIVSMIAGGLLGAGVIAAENAMELIFRLSDRYVWLVGMMGILLYTVSGVFTMTAVRKVEIRS